MDIDIDLPTNFEPLNYFDNAVRASMVKDGELKKHPVGIYLQKIARDKLTGLSAIPYDEAEKLGYFKIDFLHLSVLDHFSNKKEIRFLLKIEPDWSLLQDREVVEKLFQIHRHYDIVSKISPSSIQELADCVALIRPAKRQLVDAYLKNKKAIRPLIYAKPEDDKYYFKQGHAIAYASNIVLQLHLIKGKLI